MIYRSLWKWLQEPLHLFCLLVSLAPLYLVGQFYAAYAQRVPYFDQWTASFSVALATRNGTLSLADLMEVDGGHWHFFSNLSVAIATALTDWDLRTETFFNLVLAVANFALLIILYSRIAPQRTHWFMIPAALFIFHIAQGSNWVVSFYALWHYMIFFFLLALVLLETLPIGWIGLLLTATAVFGSHLNVGTGSTLWAIIPVVLWLRGYQRWQYFAVWIVIAAVVMGLYLSAIQGKADEGTQFAEAKAGSPAEMIQFGLVFLGAPLWRDSISGATIIGAVGLIAAGLNFLYLWRQNQHVEIWLALIAYTGIGAGAIAAGRLHIYGIEGALAPQYIALSGMLWIALAGMLLITTDLLSRSDWQRLLLTFNVIIAAMMGTLYLRSVTVYAQDHFIRDQYTLHNRPDLSAMEYCILNFPQERGVLWQCPGTDPFADDETVYVAAVHRLTAFADEPQINVLPETYQPGSPVILHSTSAWFNLYVQDYLLQGIPADNLFHIAPDSTRYPLADYADAPRQRVDHMDDTALEAITTFIENTDQVWFITMPEQEAANQVFFDTMSASGYLATPYPIQHPHYRLAKIGIYRFQQPPDTLETTLTFGDEKISLQAWTVFNSRGDSRVALASENSPLTVQPCDNVRVQSWWTSEVVPTYNYSSTLVLIAPDGQVIAQKDAAIGDNLLQLWEPGNLYLDERLITIPCEAVPGEYTLAWGTYLNTGSSFEDLPAFDAEGNALGTRAPFTQITIEGS